MTPEDFAKVMNTEGRVEEATRNWRFWRFYGVLLSILTLVDLCTYH